MIITTQLSYDHLALMQIFVDANELTGVILRPADLTVRGIIHRVIELESTNEDTSMKLTYLGIRHYGILNMFDDYLIKCGVDPRHLQPATLYMQEKEEYEAARADAFEQHLHGIMK